MIYQMVNRDTGEITETISAPKDKIAMLYIVNGLQDLYQGGEMLMPRTQLRVENGMIVRVQGDNLDTTVADDDIPSLGAELRFVGSL